MAPDIDRLPICLYYVTPVPNNSRLRRRSSICDLLRRQNAFEPKDKSSRPDGREPASDLSCLLLHLCHLGIHLFGDPVRRGNYSAALRCRLPASDCRWIAVWMVLVARTASRPTAMVREHRARGIIFPDRSWHTTLGPANASFRFGCALNSNRTNLRRHHFDCHSTRPVYSVASNRSVAWLIRRRPDYWRRRTK